jgi:hypothetical protein
MTNVGNLMINLPFGDGKHTIKILTWGWFYEIGFTTLIPIIIHSSISGGYTYTINYD